MDRGDDHCCSWTQTAGASLERALADRRRPGGEREHAADQRHEDPELGRPEVEGGVGHSWPRGPCRTAFRSMHTWRARSRRRRSLPRPSPASKTPSRIRNSPANAAEPGTASAMIPIVISTVASAGQPLRHPAEQHELTCCRAARSRPRAGTASSRRGRARPSGARRRRALVVLREQPERDQPHLRERRVRDHAADVAGAEGEQRAVDEPGGREHQQRHLKSSVGSGTSRARSAASHAPAFEITPESSAETSGGDSR